MPSATPTPTPPGVVNERGNTVGNIVNYGYVAMQGDWIYYRNPNDNNKLYKIRTDGTDRALVE